MGLFTWLAELIGGKTKPERTKTRQRQRVTAPSYAQPLLGRAARDVEQAYLRGGGGNVYQGQRVAPLASQSLAAVNQLGRIAQNYQNPYLTSLTSQPLPGTASMQAIAQAPLGGANPYFQRALDNALRSAASNISSTFAGAGRYGSGAHTGTLARTLGDVATSASAQQYNQDVANVLQASGMMNQSALQQLGAAGAAAQGQSAAAMNALRGGQYLTAHQQALLDAQRQKWHEQDERNWLRAARLGQTAQMLAGRYGTTEQTGNVEQWAANNPWANIGTVLGGVGSVLQGKPWNLFLDDKKQSS